MFAGTLIFEDQTIHFKLVEGEGEGPMIRARISDSISGASVLAMIPCRAFAACMALAFDSEGFDGSLLQEGLYALAEPVQPKIAALRIIP